ncbi:hypothetical protein [Chitinophaga sancti]|uniref:Uncharacterized protein n=1 Tax=Chitinophaga sancti TaxID=1004 RepID=A0A1K1PG41_9BACT|nr:hypothetical protein [Chitinophaga sancti]WQD65857.1 hypothetical protein U0033_15750 [Chitinophaga sancti]WQG88521.1 hypothetical protein SR876_26720 [Chitinophaga sancti]SFW46421.1 hypothetical protein SAMN05661012_01921 [Chitinophaga sancti]
MSYPACEDDIKMIEITVSSIENTERSITKGSDEHLDLILDIRNGLSENTFLIRKVVDDIEQHFNSYTVEKAQNLLAKIFPVFNLTKSINALIEKLELSNDLSTHLAAFNDEVRELSEIANDLSRYKVNTSK